MFIDILLLAFGTNKVGRVRVRNEYHSYESVQDLLSDIFYQGNTDQEDGNPGSIDMGEMPRSVSVGDIIVLNHHVRGILLGHCVVMDQNHYYRVDSIGFTKLG